MGHWWSSYAAQDLLLRKSLLAGLSWDDVLADDRPLPPRAALRWGAATDDSILTDEDRMRCAGDGLARRMRGRTNTAKWVNRARSAEVLGVSSDGHDRDMAPKASGLTRAIWATLRTVGGRRARLADLQKLTGYWCWYALLDPLTLSVMQDVYDLSRQATDEALLLPSAVFDELLALAALSPPMRADMASPRSRWVGAVDASAAAQGAGLWGAAAITPEAVVDLASLRAERRGDYIRLRRAKLDDGGPARTRVPTTLPLAASDFRVLLARRAWARRHINLHEADAIHDYLIYALRGAERHSYRFIVLSDSMLAL